MLHNEKTGLNYKEVMSFYENLVGNVPVDDFKIKKGVPVYDLNDANAYIDNAKNMFLGGTIAQAFSKINKNFTE